VQLSAGSSNGSGNGSGNGFLVNKFTNAWVSDKETLLTS
jgi:hypothetical protein